MRVTARGWGVVVVSVLLYGAAVVLGYPEVAVIAVAGFAAFALGFVWVVRRPRLRVERTIAPSRVTRGMAAFGELQVRNAGLVPSTPVVAEEQCGDRVVPVDVPRLGRGGELTKRYRLPTARRGVIPIGPLRLTRRDPFALFERVQPQGDVTELWVRPVVHLVGALPVGATRSLDGPDQDHAPNGSITFDRLREWQMGDDPRHIHWRSTARTGTLIVREHVDTSLPRLVVILDDRASAADPDAFEEAVEVAASILAAAAMEGFPAMLLTTCGGGAQSRGAGRDVEPFLDELTRVVQGDEASMAETVLRATRTAQRGSLIIVTGRSGMDSIDPLLAARRRFENTTVVVIDDDGTTVPVVANVRWVQTPSGRDFPQRWVHGAHGVFAG